jgi:hypothetical protein
VPIFSPPSTPTSVVSTQKKQFSALTLASENSVNPLPPPPAVTAPGLKRVPPPPASAPPPHVALKAANQLPPPPSEQENGSDPDMPPPPAVTAPGLKRVPPPPASAPPPHVALKAANQLFLYYYYYYYFYFPFYYAPCFARELVDFPFFFCDSIPLLRPPRRLSFTLTSTESWRTMRYSCTICPCSARLQTFEIPGPERDFCPGAPDKGHEQFVLQSGAVGEFMTNQYYPRMSCAVNFCDTSKLQRATILQR